ncbi:MAG: F0F1 ATP synthase subunit A [Cytophagaceae bacterium]
MGSKINKIVLAIVFTALSFAGIASSEEEVVQHAVEVEDTLEAFNPGELIMHHIQDAHDWHFFDIGHFHATLPLPVIVYSSGKGLSVFSSSKFEHGEVAYNGYKNIHEHIVAVDAAGNIDESIHVYDFSITKNIASLILSVVILLLVFFKVAKGYETNKGKAPTGIQSFFEPIIVFIRDDIGKNMIGEKYEKYMPYLLTVFFFIWFNNLLGLMPGGANLTGNIAVTLCLALITFLITSFSANKYYWKHIFATPGVPPIMLIIIVPIELVGVFTKPFSLMIRLFANITAGHIIILSFLSLIFIFQSIYVSPVSVAFGIFMSFMELFVAIVQAYIFTLLSAMYFGSAIEDHGHHADHDHGH